MQYKVPQNVQQADKIVGPLTLKQLIICAIGGGVSYFIYVSTAKLYIITIWLPATAIPALITTAVAFLKISGIPFIKFCLLELERLVLDPPKRYFVKGASDPYVPCLGAISIAQSDKKILRKQDEKKEKMTEHIKNIDNITKILDTKENGQ